MTRQRVIGAANGYDDQLSSSNHHAWKHHTVQEKSSLTSVLNDRNQRKNTYSKFIIFLISNISTSVQYNPQPVFRVGTEAN